MPKKRYDVDQIIPMLRRADVELGKGRKVPEVCKMLGIVQQTYYRWRQKYGSMAPEMAKELKALQKENSQLKKLVADQALGHIEGSREGKLPGPERRRRAVDEVRRKLGPDNVSQRRACRVYTAVRKCGAWRANCAALWLEGILVGAWLAAHDEALISSTTAPSIQDHADQTLVATPCSFPDSPIHSVDENTTSYLAT